MTHLTNRFPIEFEACDPPYIADTGVCVEVVNVRNIHSHIHENALEFVYCLSGSINFTLAHESGTVLPGELVTVDFGDVRNMYSDVDNMTLIVHIDSTNSHIPIERLTNTVFACATVIADAEGKRNIEIICDKLLALLYLKTSHEEDGSEFGSPAYDKYVNSLKDIRLSLIDFMYDKFAWFLVKNQSTDDMKYRDRLQTIIDYVSHNFKDKITISQISRVLYLNPAYLSSFIRRTSFGSFTSLVNYYRCIYAQKLLLKTNLSVGDISGMSGFSSEKYFYRYFKEFWKTTPLQYRRRTRERERYPEQFSAYDSEGVLTTIKDLIAQRHVERAGRTYQTLSTPH